MAKKHLIAKDCMPFYLKGVEQAKMALQVNAQSEALALLNDVDYCLPVGKQRHRNDDSKIAYSPYENKPYTFPDGTSVRVWQAGRYIGEVVMGETRVTIKPRFGEQCLLAMLNDICHFKYVPSANTQGSGKDWNEIVKHIVRYLWIQKFAHADRYGLPRLTVKHQHQGLQVRGHLNPSKTLLPFFAHREVVSEFRTKETDHRIGKIIYAAYHLLAKGGFSRDLIPPHIQDSLNTLSTTYHGKDCTVCEDEYQTIRYKRIYQSWKPLTDFSWQILKQRSFSMTNSIEQQGSSLLLDMAEIWESFLRNHIGAILATDDFGNWTTVPQAECATQVYGSQFYHREIIPDLLFQREYEGKTQYIVLDAKYKRMKGQKADVDRGDFFQIHSYIQYYASLKNAEVVLGGLLYPLESLDVDKHNWQASSLFDLTEGNTQFVVDGIFLNDIPSNSDSPETISLVLHQRIEQMVKAWNIHG